jgi:hypothetical protein
MRASSAQACACNAQFAGQKKAVFNARESSRAAKTASVRYCAAAVIIDCAGNACISISA